MALVKAHYLTFVGKLKNILQNTFDQNFPKYEIVLHIKTSQNSVTYQKYIILRCKIQHQIYLHSYQK